MIDLYTRYLESYEFLLSHGSDFAKKYPKVASSLGIGEHNITDPDIRKVVESFALFDARINHNIDQEKNRVAKFIMNYIAPELCVATPGCFIASFSSDREITVPAGSLIKTSNDKTGSEFQIPQSFVVSKSVISNTVHTKTNLDPKLQKFACEACFILDLSLTTNAVELYINSEAAPNIIRNIFAAHPESEPQIYDYESGEVVGVIRRVEKILYDTGNPYGGLYNYQLLNQSANFIELSFHQKPLTKCIILLAEAMRNVGSGIFTTNCSPAVNLFVKKSEPVKFTSLKDQIDIIPEILGTELKVQQVKGLFAYDPSKGTQSKISDKNYLTILENNQAQVFLRNTKLGEHIILFAELLCSNQNPIYQDNVSIENMSYIKGNIITTSNNSDIAKTPDVWSIISVFAANYFENAITSNTILDFCNNIMDIYGIPGQPFQSITYYEGIGIVKHDMITVPVVNSIFKITLNPNLPEAFLIAMIWAGIFIDINNIRLDTQVHIFAGTKLLKVISVL